MSAAPRPGAPEGPLAALYEGTLDCVHCGLCLPVCPTYRETGRESSSPRGRIHLIRAVAEGRLPLDEVLAEEAYLCLDCRACETACPSGVRFGRLVEQTRAAVETAGLRTGPAKRLERFALRHVVPDPVRLRRAVGLLALAQRLGLDRAARALLPRRLAEVLALAPRVPPRAERERPAWRTEAQPREPSGSSGPRGRVALFTGCVMAELFGDVHHATVRVLARNGFEVLVPRTQRCCGALHAHAGDAASAHTLLRANLAAFAGLRVDAIVVNSAGCGAALREAGDWLPGEGEALARLVRDPLELLDEAGLRPPEGRLALRVCYDDPCHLVHGQRVREAPRRILRQIPGLELVAHDDPTGCCGAAGIYNLTHPEMAGAVLERKLRALAAARPDVVATGNPGCIMQLRAGAARSGLRAEILHPITLLDRAYLQEERASRAKGV
ncbi:MAG: heterodisulfide reductase-related iron-sulfur binding cluster [Deltaproteobacteria bacterium]|nr:heterodisulfide reductase-related iron-sulfur binding cluster [Deltaproteobacteria bacterium]